jgi:hypothetical protein
VIEMASITNEYTLQEEMVIFARNQDILTTTERGVTTFTDTLTYTSGAPTFSLTHSGVRNIRFVTVQGSTKTAYREFTPNYNSGTFTLTATPNPSDSVVVRYDYGTSDTVYSELPREIVDRLHFPRLMVRCLIGNTEEFALGGGSNVTDRMVTFQVWATTVKKVNNVATNIRTSIIGNKKNFYNTPFMKLNTISGLQQSIGQEPEIFSKAIDCDARFVVERV